MLISFSYHPALCFSSSVIFLLVDACVGLNWLLVSFLSHVNKNIIHSFIHSFIIILVFEFLLFLCFHVLWTLLPEINVHSFNQYH